MAAAGDAGMTLLRFVAERGGVSEDEALAAIERGGAFVAGRRVRDAGATVRGGARVEIDLRAPPPATAPTVLHLDRDVVAVDKPAGVLAQEGRAGGPSLPDLVAAIIGGPALLVHRLDRGTTGVTLLARTRAAQAALLERFRRGEVEKEYRALVAGAPERDEGVIDLALGSDPSAPGRRRPDARGEPASTRYRVLERFVGAALVACFPETGRTHQIRAHLAALGHPLLGDARYGGPRALTLADGTRLSAARPLLHALRLRVGGLEVRAPEPADLLDALALLRRG